MPNLRNLKVSINPFEDMHPEASTTRIKEPPDEGIEVMKETKPQGSEKR
jgi:hypothetical protein